MTKIWPVLTQALNADTILSMFCDEAKKNLTLLFSFSTRSRSEEHTSELQSLTNLVCRLLLEKKKEQDKNAVLTRLAKQSASPAGTGLRTLRPPSSLPNPYFLLLSTFFFLVVFFFFF